MIAIILLVLLLPSTVLAVTLPTLPQSQVEVTMPTVNGSTLNATCANLQAQIDAAAALNVNLTHKIILATGTTCTGPYLLPSHTGGTGWIIITGPNLAQLTAGVRVAPAQASLMPQIKYGTDGVSHVGAFSAATGAQRYRLIGLDVVQDSTISPNAALIVTGYGNQNALNTGHIIIDRMLIRDTDISHATFRGVFADAQNGHVALIDSYVAGIQDVGNVQDTQAILAISNPGPILVQNTYLEASGENLMIGGGAPASSAVLPHDITIKRNTFDKLARWHGVSNHQVKALIEFKFGVRVLVEGNDFFNMPWNDGGYAFRLTVRNEDGSASFAELADVTIRHNLVKNVTNWISYFGADDQGAGFLTKRLKRVHIHNNLVYGLGWLCGEGATCGAAMLDFTGSQSCTDPISASCQVRDFSFAHNTIDDVGAWVLNVDSTGARDFDFKDNLINVNGGRGAWGPSGYGTIFLGLVYSTTYQWINNRMAEITGEGESSADYPQVTNSYPASFSSFLWTNRTVRDYTLQSGSPAKNAASDGTDQGVNFAQFLAARSVSIPPIACMP